MTASVDAPDKALSPKAKDELLEALAGVQEATFDLLINKPRRTTTFVMHVQDKDSQIRPVKIKYQAMDPSEYDELLAAHPPTPKEERKGGQWNKDTFPPALISAVSMVPKLSVDQASQLLKSPNWATGESNALFWNAVNVCQAGLDVPFSEGD